MTIKEFIEDAKRAAQNLTPQDGSRPYDQLAIETTCVWSNYACRGYVIEAMRRSGYQEEQIHEVLKHLSHAFDDLTLDQAEQIYQDF